jgi:hypothetical protein
MNALAVGVVTFACVFGGAVLGLFLRTVLPEHHLREDSKDVVKLVTGLIATLSALVLGLLIASAKTSFDAVNDAFSESAARVILVDRVLAQYGPEAKEIRDLLRRAIAQRFQQLFPDQAAPGAAMESLRGGAALEAVQTRVRALDPGNAAQRELQSRALQVMGDLAQVRWLTFERSTSSTPPAFLVVLVSWLAAMFASFGLFAPRHATAMAALLIGALSVSTAIFLIEEMNHPLDGIIAISGEPMRNALAVLGK